MAVVLKLWIFILKLSISNCSYHHQYNKFWANQDYQILFQQNIENKEIINYQDYLIYMCNVYIYKGVEHTIL